MKKGTKGEIGLYKCKKCDLLQNLLVSEIKRQIADEFAYMDSFVCKHCGFVNEYRFPREDNSLYF